jgi:phosphogluconate dehydratase
VPEAADGGPLAFVRDGDLIRLDAGRGELEVLVDPSELRGRAPARPSAGGRGYGRELFASFRERARSAEEGATVF